MRDGWKDTTLSEVLTISRERIDPSRLEPDCELIHWSIPQLDETGGPNNENASEIGSHKFAVLKDSVVYSLLNPRIPRFAKIAGGQRVVCSTEFAVLQPDSSLSLDFLYCFVSSPNFQEQVRSLAKGTTKSRERIDNKEIDKIHFKLPPLPEQKRIVDLISSVDSYIEALQQQLESAKRSRNAVLHKLLTVGEDDWEYKILSDICEVRDGTHDSPKPSDKGFALVTSKNIKDGRLDLESAYLISPQDYEEVNKRSKVEQYNLLISMIGTIGEVIVIEGEPDFAIKNVGLLKSTEPILSRYLCHYLGSQLGKNAISLSVSGSTQKFISLGKLRALPVLYPPMEDQKAIVEAMSLFDQQISKNLEVTARIKNLRSSLLSDLLSGEHEIHVSYDKVIGAA